MFNFIKCWIVCNLNFLVIFLLILLKFFAFGYCALVGLFWQDLLHQVLEAVRSLPSFCWTGYIQSNLFFFLYYRLHFTTFLLSVYLFLLPIKCFIYLFIFGQRRRETEREERNISVLLPLMCPLLGTWPAAQACALTGTPASDPLVHRPAVNLLSTPARAQCCFIEKTMFLFFSSLSLSSFFLPSYLFIS